MGGEGRGGRRGVLPLWVYFGLLCPFYRHNYRGIAKVLFQISRLDSEAGVGPISLCYCCTNVCSIFVHERQHCCG